MARDSALRVVDPDPAPDEALPGDPQLTAEAVAGWTAGQRKCRARRRHNWRPLSVWEHPGFYDVSERCADCRNQRRADFVKTPSGGLRKEGKWHPDYRGNYLLPKGAAPIDDDTHDHLVAGDILSRRILQAPEEDD